MGEHVEIVESGAGRPLLWSFSTYLDAYPEARDALRQRIEQRPEYRAWLREMRGTVLAALETASPDGHRARY